VIGDMVTLRCGRKLRCESNGRFHLTVIRRGPIHAQQLPEPICLFLSICKRPRGGCGKGSPRTDGDDIIERKLSSGGSTHSHAVTPIPEDNHHQGTPTLRCNCNFERGARRESMFGGNMSHANVRGQNKAGRDSVRAWRLSNVSRVPIRCLYRPIRVPRYNDVELRV